MRRKTIQRTGEQFGTSYNKTAFFLLEVLLWNSITMHWGKESENSEGKWGENGAKKMSIETFAEVAHALNISMDELISGCVSGESKITSYDFSKILADCSEYEKHVLADTLKAVKQSLKANEEAFGVMHLR